MHEELTELSFQYLKKFLEYCNKHKVFPVLVGGWAVWSYTKADASVDVDIVLKNKSELKKIKPFFDEHGLKEEANGGISFVKQISQEGIGLYKLKHLIFDISFFLKKAFWQKMKKFPFHGSLWKKILLRQKLTALKFWCHFQNFY
ncbi:MAG: hypothetical protein HYW50_01345 [Candidatus Diapherotrites archaeon]|nr:hypothetical protein [Candidatus Diapherotrites archaeon]